MAITSEGYKVECPAGQPRFSGIASSGKPKLYIVSVGEIPVYIGITTQRMSARLRFGWRANGKNGYHGYRWRHHLTTANLDVWCHENAPDEKPELDMETVEAEIVFLIRSKGDWPKYQTEIHFHASTPEHRQLADTIVSRYRLGGAGDAKPKKSKTKKISELKIREQS